MQRTIAMKIGYRERWLGARFVCYLVGIRDWEYFLVLYCYVLLLPVRTYPLHIIRV
jgi:hypothetical protein